MTLIRTIFSKHHPIIESGSQRAPVEALYRYGVKIYAFEATNIDSRYFFARRICAFAKWMNAASAAKAMFDDMAIERVGAATLLPGE